MNSNRQTAAQSGSKLLFDQVMRHGSKVSTTAIAARVMPSDGPQLGLAVSRRYGNAVSRNLFKRRTRAAFRKHQAALPNIAVVVSPTEQSGKVGYASIDGFFVNLCEYSA